MQLQFNDLTIHAVVSSKTTLASPHTGKMLEQRAVEIYTGNRRAHEKLLEMKRGHVVEEADAPEMPKWVLREASWSSRSDGRSESYSHHWQIVEAEFLQPTAILVENLRLVPYQYVEEVDADGKLSITAKVKLSIEEDRALMTTLYSADRHTIVREGLQDQSREMVFLIGVWANNDGEIRRVLRMRESGAATILKHGLLEPQHSNTERKLVRVEATLRHLTATLKQKGLLSEDDVAQIGMVNEQESREGIESFSQVENIDDWDD